MTEEVKNCFISTYLDIALCSIKTENWKEGICACNSALDINPDHAKALYRKSIAITTPAGSGIDDYRTGIDLLKKAIHIEPNNKTLREKLQEFKLFVNDQNAKSKETFTSFFKKPNFDNYNP
jgi:tetratricopeptide (TPR) repeat protein